MICICICLTGLCYSLSLFFLWRGRERKGHRPPPPIEPSSFFPFYNKSQFPEPPAQTVTRPSSSSTIISTFSLSLSLPSLPLSQISIFFSWFVHLWSEFSSGYSRFSEKVYFLLNWISSLAMSTSDAGGAGSNDSNATRRQSKRPKCNNSLILSFVFGFPFLFLVIFMCLPREFLLLVSACWVGKG